MLHGRRIQLGADALQQRFAFRAIVAEHAQLDELVGEQVHVDFVQYRGGEAMGTDGDDGAEMVGLGAQGAALRGIEGKHARSLTVVVRAGITAAARSRVGWPARPHTLVLQKMAPKATRKHRFNKAWMQEHVNDHWVQEAKRLGYRSRAAFKLRELAERDELLRPGMTVVDLGAAPGSWAQVLRERVGRSGFIVAVDVLPMDPVPGVTFIQGDFREQETLAALEGALAGRTVDLVVSDMAPNLSGIASADQARSVHLGELALEFAVKWLQPGGGLVVKAFQGAGFPEFQRQMQGYFDKTYARKPKSSRDRSPELYLVGKGFSAA